MSNEEAGALIVQLYSKYVRQMGMGNDRYELAISKAISALSKVGGLNESN